MYYDVRQLYKVSNGYNAIIDYFFTDIEKSKPSIASESLLSCDGHHPAI